MIQVRPDESDELCRLLSGALGTTTVVDKQRCIFWIENVKFHVDEVVGLGAFVEIEAIDKTGEIGREVLLSQCQHYLDLLGIGDAALEPRSYSDLVGQKL